MEFDLLQKELIRLASEYLNISEFEVIENINKNDDMAISDWNTKKSIDSFYRETSVYIFGLIAFNNIERVSNLIYPIKGAEGNKILDFGGGIGVISTIMATHNDSFYYDVESKTQDFAKFLVKKSEREVRFLTKEELKGHKFDLIICSDVLEHLENPMKIVKLLDSLLIKNGTILTTGLDFSVNQPMHLPENIKCREEYTKYMLKNYMLLFFHKTKNENIYLWGKK